MTLTEPVSTRDRILETATDLFIEQGYETTSLREIAERVGVTKAALYYHFASKAELVEALVEPLARDQKEFLDALPASPTIVEWADALDALVDWMVANRRLFQLFERNHEVFERMHDEGSWHLELHDRINQIVGDPTKDAVTRVRMAAGLGAAAAMVGFGDGLIDDVDDDEMGVELKAAIRRVLALAPEGEPVDPGTARG